MAKRTASAKKQARAGARRSVRNRAVRSEVKTLVVKARRALGDGSAEPADRAASTVDAVRALDRAVAKGVLHPNNAARRKGRLARQHAKLAAAAPAATSGTSGSRATRTAKSKKGAAASSSAKKK